MAVMAVVYLFGSIEQVASTALALADRLEERTGFQLNLGKSAIHSNNPARDAASLASDASFSAVFRTGMVT